VISWWAYDALDPADADQIKESREQIINDMVAALDEAAISADAAWSFSVES
jgi:hypothetical protein